MLDYVFKMLIHWSHRKVSIQLFQVIEINDTQIFVKVMSKDNLLLFLCSTKTSNRYEIVISFHKLHHKHLEDSIFAETRTIQFNSCHSSIFLFSNSL